ncbi:hypothetical protein PFICI_02747 [Pestalotiopsis fici W106-1]|uniref:Uncharacterized protein n=1 Tax=Pestalotiopsis fici (strain W106-1 / CGMCC3.15140) TaxID=1229662 RepID=W3XH34_PESFW|nr:uncharacterized protein PFICI_02747 [Pestalotiopsis fici W106-1]ETS84722.1 hypothetical protein PFICI_02747 [Pestalotiopsis fici W106-1]
MIAKYAAALLATLSAPVFAGPVYRLVDELDQDSYQQAQQRDDTATRMLSNINIKTSKGKCLFVDQLSGDSAANLTPIQVAGCGATDGQGFDIITQGKHNDAANSILIVSTLTQACFTFDPTQTTGKQVMLFSCGGVADGSGNVTTSQLFPGDGSAGSLTLAPENQATSCLTVKGNSVEIADCEDGNEAQTFILDDGTASEAGNEKVDAPATTTAASSANAIATSPGEQLITVTCQAVTVTQPPVTVTATESVTVTVTEASTSPDSTTDTTSTTTLFITVDPISSTNSAESFSSTTTIFVTIPFVEVVTPSSAVPTASSAPSSKAPSDPNTIPQISINPSTTVVVTGATTAPTVSSSAAVVATTASSSKAPSDPNTIPQISINPSTTVVVQ